MKSRILPAIALAVALQGADAVSGAPPFVAGIQGDWHVLTVHSGNQNLALDTPTMHGSRLVLTADSVLWADPQAADAPWLRASCERVPPPAEGKADPNELRSTVTGSLVPVQDAITASRWKLTDYGVLLLLVQRAVFTGNRNGIYSGAAQADVILSLRRDSVPPFQAPAPAADRQAFPGTWSVLTEMDDANSARTRAGGHVVITPERIDKFLGGARPTKTQGSGSYAILDEATGGFGRFDLHEDAEGRSPSLYAFCGPDLLYIVYPESQGNKVPPEQRQPPPAFRSDGNCNLWILQRRPASAP